MIYLYDIFIVKFMNLQFEHNCVIIEFFSIQRIANFKFMTSTINISHEYILSGIIWEGSGGVDPFFFLICQVHV